jgi:hypothetical protein
MDRFCNNRDMSVNILTATNADNNRITAISMRRPVNNKIGEPLFSMRSAPSKRT